jgi:hypothetical protein
VNLTHVDGDTGQHGGFSENSGCQQISLPADSYYNQSLYVHIVFPVA